ncbi:MAG: ankyrin repeat domain-containing protein [Alphaproteobacteria bacterium]
MFRWIRKTALWEWNDKRRAENILRDIGRNVLCNEKELNAKLIHAVDENMPETVKALVKAGASPDAQIYYEHGYTTYSYPVIARAALRDQPHMVKTLVEAGANIDKADTLDGHTPLIEAVRCGNAAAVRQLLDLGADLTIRTNIHSRENTRSITPTSPLEIAERHAFVGIIKMLKDEPARREQARVDAETAQLEAELAAAQKAAADAKALANMDPSVTQTSQGITVMEPLQIKRRKGLFP